MNLLSEIISVKRQRVAEAKQRVPLNRLRVLAQEARTRAKPHALVTALRQEARINIIAEFKRRSPSKGEIKTDADPADTARAYETGGAAAISVLTEKDHFSGSLDDLRAIRAATKLPILRKDFIFDDYQLYESAASGADALLLIVAAVDDESLLRLRATAEDDLQMDALVEVHTADEMQRAIDCGAGLIGVNNRNLMTFEVSLDTSVQLARGAPTEAVLISESGIESADDIDHLRTAGYRGFLIGESLMRAENPEFLLRSLALAQASTPGARSR